jgi:CRISPR/Cas system-associated exonuclease Cas4 (RecB family)
MSKDQPDLGQGLVDFLLSEKKNAQGNDPARRSARSRTIRASELGTYLYCRRAWWLDRQGVPSNNKAKMRSGTRMHQKHGRQVFAATLNRALGYILLLAGLVMLTIYLTQLAL